MSDKTRDDSHRPDEEDVAERPAFKIPSAISLRDVIIIVTAVITVVSAWGVYGTRLALVEDKIVQHEKRLDGVESLAHDIQKKDSELANAIVELKARVLFLERTKP
jgi:hypothetical protein